MSGIKVGTGLNNDRYILAKNKEEAEAMVKANIANFTHDLKNVIDRKNNILGENKIFRINIEINNMENRRW